MLAPVRTIESAQRAVDGRFAIDGVDSARANATTGTVPFNRLISALRNHIGRPSPNLYDTIRARIVNREIPLSDDDEINNVSNVDTMGTFVDEHFAEPEEAVREIITNAYDSMHAESDPQKRHVAVKLGEEQGVGLMEVSDHGTGMDLDTVLKKFYPPFEGGKTNPIFKQIKDIIGDGRQNKISRIKKLVDSGQSSELSETERLTLNDIRTRVDEASTDEEETLRSIENLVTFTGRFGIGFYSLLYFLETDEDLIEVITSTGNEAYKIVYQRQSGQLQTGIEALEPNGLSHGTKVSLRSQKFNVKSAHKVVRKSLSFNGNAQISLSVNGDQSQVINKEVFDPQNFTREADSSRQVEAFYSQGLNPSGKTAVYINVHGVTIMSREIEGFGMPEAVVFNFPANIGLPISRNRVLVNDLFIEKAKDMIGLIAFKPALLSAFFPCIDALESGAKASYRNILASEAADAAHGAWASRTRAYLPNSKEFTRIAHNKAVLVNEVLLRRVSRRAFSNNYSLIGEPLSFDSEEEVKVGNKKVYLVEFTDETKLVATNDAILINKKYVPETDSDIALYNVLLELNNEAGFEYKYESQAPTEAEAKDKPYAETGEKGETTDDGIEVIYEADVQRDDPPSEDTPEFQAALASIQDEGAKELFRQAVRYAYHYIGYDQATGYLFSNVPLFLELYNLYYDNVSAADHQYIRQFIPELTINLRLFYGDNPSLITAILRDEHLADLFKYFSYTDAHKFIKEFLEHCKHISTDSDEKTLSPEAVQTALKRLSQLRNFIDSRSRDAALLTRAVFLDDETYQKFYERFTESVRQRYFHQYAEILDRNRLTCQAFELFLDGNHEALFKIARIYTRLPETDDISIYEGRNYRLALSMRNMSDTQVDEFLESVDFSAGYSIKILSVTPILPYYLRFFYGEERESRFGDYFKSQDNIDGITALEDIMKSGLPIQEKKRFIEAMVEAADMPQSYADSEAEVSFDLLIEQRGYLNLTPERQMLFPFDFDPTAIAEIDNPAQFINFVLSMDPFNEELLYRKYAQETHDADLAFGYDYALRYKKELLEKLIIIYRYISNLPVEDFDEICSDFHSYFYDGISTSRIEPFIQYLTNSSVEADTQLDEPELAPQRKFSLVELYDTFLELSEDQESQEESAAERGDFSGVDSRIASIAGRVHSGLRQSVRNIFARGFRRPFAARSQTRQPLTPERRALLENAFRAAAQQTVDDLVMLREVAQNVLDEITSGETNQNLHINAYPATIQTPDGEQGLTVLDIEDTIGMDAERLYNKLLMPFSSSKKDPEKFLGKQGQGFFTLLAHSEYVIIKTVRKGKVRILKLTPVRDQGQVVDFQVEEEHRRAAPKEGNGTRIQVFTPSVLPGLEEARISHAARKFTGLVDSDKLAVMVNGSQVNLNNERWLATEGSNYGEIGFYSMPGESFLALGGLFVKPLDDEFLALVPPALRPILLKQGFAVNLPFQHIRRIQGGSDIADRPQVYADIEDAVMFGTTRLAISMFSLGELPSLNLLGRDYYEYEYSQQAADDAKAIMDGSADIEDIKRRYFSASSSNLLAKLLLAVPLEFLTDIFGRPMSLAQLFNEFRSDSSSITPEIRAELPKSIDKALKAIEEKGRKVASQEETAKELGVPDEFIGDSFIKLPHQQGAGMAAYWAFLEMSDAMAEIAVETILEENTQDDLGAHIHQRLQNLKSSPPRGHYYAQPNGLSTAHAQQGGGAYAWNLLEQAEALDLFAQYLTGAITPVEFLDRAFENIVGTVSHELVHIVEESGEGTHNNVFRKRHKLMVSAMIGAKGRVADILASLPRDTRYAGNVEDVSVKDFLAYADEQRKVEFPDKDRFRVQPGPESATEPRQPQSGPPNSTTIEASPIAGPQSRQKALQSAI